MRGWRSDRCLTFSLSHDPISAEPSNKQFAFCMEDLLLQRSGSAAESKTLYMRDGHLERQPLKGLLALFRKLDRKEPDTTLDENLEALHDLLLADLDHYLGEELSLKEASRKKEIYLKKNTFIHAQNYSTLLPLPPLHTHTHTHTHNLIGIQYW